MNLSAGFPKFTFSFSFIRDLEGRGGAGDTWQYLSCWNVSGKLFFNVLGKEKIEHSVSGGVMQLSVFQAITERHLVVMKRIQSRPENGDI